MKTITLKAKNITAIVILFITGISIIFFTNNKLSNTVKNYLASNEIAASILYSALFILGFNILIFAIGYFAKDKAKKSSIVRKVYHRSRINRRRRIEIRQLSVLSHLK